MLNNFMKGEQCKNFWFNVVVPSHHHPVIRFVSIGTKKNFYICTVVDIKGTLVEAKNMTIQVSPVRI